MTLTAEQALVKLDDLVDLLIDAVEGGASVGFLAPLSREEAAAYWSGVIDAIGAGNRILIAIEHGGRVIGTVQIARETRANGRHRGEALKLFVHSSFRRGGLARRLMAELEGAARAAGITLLLMDTRKDSQGERLCESLGYTRWGEVPDYARDPDGTLRATSFYYRRLNA